jgi:hypothetical protein
MRVGQAARTGLLRERESDNGPFRRSRLLRSTLAGARCGDATPAEGSRPPGSSGARRRGSFCRTDPRVVLWILVQRDGGLLHSARAGRSIIEVGSRSKDRVHTGSPRAPTPIAVPRAARPPGVRGSLFHPPSPGPSPGEHRGRSAGNSDLAYGLGSGARPCGRQTPAESENAVRNCASGQRSGLNRREGIARR